MFLKRMGEAAPRNRPSQGRYSVRHGNYIIISLTLITLTVLFLSTYIEKKYEQDPNLGPYENAITLLNARRLRDLPPSCVRRLKIIEPGKVTVVNTAWNVAHSCSFLHPSGAEVWYRWGFRIRDHGKETLDGEEVKTLNINKFKSLFGARCYIQTKSQSCRECTNRNMYLTWIYCGKSAPYDLKFYFRGRNSRGIVEVDGSSELKGNDTHTGMEVTLGGADVHDQESENSGPESGDGESEVLHSLRSRHDAYSTTPKWATIIVESMPTSNLSVVSGPEVQKPLSIPRPVAPRNTTKSLMSICGGDELVELGEKIAGIHAAIGRVVTKYVSEEDGHEELALCTGFMVSSDTFITAAHCLKKEGYRRVEVRINPGATPSKSGRGYLVVKAGYLECYREGRIVCDIGGGKIHPSVAGKFPYLQTSSKPLPFFGKLGRGVAKVCGYPAEDWPVAIQHLGKGKAATSAGWIMYNADTLPGMSGGPVFLSKGAGVAGMEEVVFGVHTNSPCPNKANKLLPGMVRRFIEM